ncbi:MAG: glycosyltransferase family 4 protein [Anaerolineae bacterium]|nr:glycosyltransferase family 4 protein [Anaerolineae bacterium]
MALPPLCVCLLSGTYPPAESDGIARHTYLVARGLAELGHTVHVVCRGERRLSSVYDGVYVHRIPYSLERYGQFRELPILFHNLNYSHAAYEEALRLVDKENVRLIDSPLWGLEGLVAAVSGIVPVVLRLQTSVRQVSTLQARRDEQARLIGELERTFIERASYWIPNSCATLDAIQSVYGVSCAQRRYTVIPHGIIPVPDDQVRPFDLRQSVKRELVVLYVGRLEQRKGILDLFQAIPLVLKQVPAASFVIAGQDNSQHDGFYQRMKVDYPTYFSRRYRAYTSRVTFTGRVNDRELAALYQSCDLFVAPSLYESFGLIYLEAMNYAKPVIGCRAGGVPEVIEDGITGLLVPPGAPSALAEAIISLLTSPDLLHQMGLAGRQRLLQQFSYTQMAQRFEQAYRAVLSDSSVV